MADETEKKPQDPERLENLRAEYAALTSYFTAVITFRFTIVGFFFAAAGLIIQAGLTRSTVVVLFLLGLGAWIVELRNRAIFAALLDRAVQIEGEWGYREALAFDSFFRRMFRIELQKRLAAEAGKTVERPFPPDEVRIFRWKARLPETVISHSVGLDVIYLGVLAFSLYKALRLFIDWGGVAGWVGSLTTR